MQHDSAASWLEDLRAGSDEAVRKLVARYYEPLVELARKRLTGRARRAGDEEDVALSAVNSFVQAARHGAFGRLNGGDDLWRLLVTICVRKARKHIKRETARKRGGKDLRGESVFGTTPIAGIEGVAEEGPTPESRLECEEMADQVLAFLSGLDDTMERDIALWTAQGMTSAQLAAHLGCSSRTIERKLRSLRKRARKWAEQGNLTRTDTRQTPSSGACRQNTFFDTRQVEAIVKKAHTFADFEAPCDQVPHQVPVSRLLTPIYPSPKC